MIREVFILDANTKVEMAESDRKNITIHQLLEKSAQSALNIQREDGSFPAGRNYTYDEPETPVRTTSHWAVTLSEVYKITGEDIFQKAANAAIDYLLSDEVRPYGYTFHCRDATDKDQCNGVVGQGGPIRALSYAGPILGRKDAIETAIEVFALHPFNPDLGLWERVEINGKKLSFDRTLNHQVLFAAAGSKLASESDLVNDRVEAFLNNLETNMRLHSDGLIKHYVRPPPIDVIQKVLYTPRHYEMIINELVYHYYSRSDERRKKERGYHTVNLSALSRIKRSFGEHSIWESNTIKRSLKFLLINKEELITKIDTKHGSGLPGVATAKTLYWLGNRSSEELCELVSIDVSKNLDRESYLLYSDGSNQHNQAARISLLVDFPNIQLSL
ncbi:hypothetical protein [Halobellus rarus]|uniref:Uncharacterized protein n=1 Tax=Halobellus rarus TaxID=1126237 RepID=A0ABD6CME0_9EURY|nr:hypothetical protein [Halobellus rarus]